MWTSKMLVGVFKYLVNTYGPEVGVNLYNNFYRELFR